MVRIYVVVEGQTEESFVNEILVPAFSSRAIYLNPRILGKPGHKGGRVNYARLKIDILAQLKQDRSCYCTTMIDLYALGAGFPGMPLSIHVVSQERAVRIEEEMKRDIVGEIPEFRPDVRFIPYIQVHEFEGLLFSDPVAFAVGIRQPHLTRSFTAVRQAYSTPEDINDKPNTAPSKQVLAIYPAYNKVLDGPLGAGSVGIDRMRQECPHFRSWLERLEALGEV